MFWGLRVGREPARDYSLTLLLSELQRFFFCSSDSGEGPALANSHAFMVFGLS